MLGPTDHSGATCPMHLPALRDNNVPDLTASSCSLLWHQKQAQRSTLFVVMDTDIFISVSMKLKPTNFNLKNLQVKFASPLWGSVYRQQRMDKDKKWTSAGFFLKQCSVTELGQQILLTYKAKESFTDQFILLIWMFSLFKCEKLLFMYVEMKK